jgi:hypothetical protein
VEGGGVVVSKVRQWVAAHRKLIVSLAGMALTVALQVWGPDNPYVSLGVLVATSLGVYGAPNRDEPPSASPLLAAPAAAPSASPPPGRPGG